MSRLGRSTRSSSRRAASVCARKRADCCTCRESSHKGVEHHVGSQAHIPAKVMKVAMLMGVIASVLIAPRPPCRLCLHADDSIEWHTLWPLQSAAVPVTLRSTRHAQAVHGLRRWRRIGRVYANEGEHASAAPERPYHVLPPRSPVRPIAAHPLHAARHDDRDAWRMAAAGVPSPSLQ